MTDWRFPPQVSALVTMYSHEEDIDSAIDVFKQTIGYYQSEQVGALQCYGLDIVNVSFVLFVVLFFSPSSVYLLYADVNILVSLGSFQL